MLIAVDEGILKKEIGKRLKEVRAALKLSQKDFAKELWTTQPTVANIERGAIYPNIIILLVLSQKQINLKWLISGIGKMVIHETDSHYFSMPLNDRYINLINVMMTNKDIEEIILAKAKDLALLLNTKPPEKDHQ